MQDILEDIRESIASVLGEQCDSLAVHAHIDGKRDLAAKLHELSRDLGWLAISLPEANNGIGLGAQGLATLHYELGRAAAPANLLPSSVAIEALSRGAARVDGTVANLVADVVGGTASIALAASFEVMAADAPIWLLGTPSAGHALVPGAGNDCLLVTFHPDVAEKLSLWDETRSAFRVDPAALKAVATLPGLRRDLTALYALAVAADSAGAARGSLDRTVEYMKVREQFGRPIGSFQALKHRAADHQVNGRAADELVFQAAETIDAAGDGAFMWAIMAKANVVDAAARITGDCVQLHGGVGFTREYDPHLYLKRVRFNEVLLAQGGTLRDWAEQEFRAALGRDQDILEMAG